MKSPVIMIGLLGKPPGKMKEEGGLLESDMEMPEAMSDSELNKQNKAQAVLKASYGPATGAQKCASCEYFSTDYPKLGKGQGFCELWEFTCSDKNVCAAYEFNEELKGEEEYEGEDEESE